jgi:hypothetical protein
MRCSIGKLMMSLNCRANAAIVLEKLGWLPQNGSIHAVSVIKRGVTQNWKTIAANIE